MSKVDSKSWLIASVDRMRKAELEVLVASLPGDLSPFPRRALKTCDAMRAFITLARRFYYQDLELKPQIRTLQKQDNSNVNANREPINKPTIPICETNADQANDWLCGSAMKESL
ncbi:hypothetical protein ACOTTU_10870 [Roseobacter sp. EG26]|uniref:hypothetical protein n=1 Tax=Roseobacter sp. EG26 TaxID=3412477 RepID=UPI003CE5490C